MPGMPPPGHSGSKTYRFSNADGGFFGCLLFFILIVFALAAILGAAVWIFRTIAGI